MAERPKFYRDQMSERAFFRGAYLGELQKRVGSSFWKSPDISLRQSVLLSPGYVTYALINFPGNLQLFGGLPVDLITYMSTSTRSRFAQVGLEVCSAGQTIAETLKDDVYKTRENSSPAYVALINHAQRPIEIDKDIPLFRLYSSRFLVDEVLDEGLLQLLRDGDVALTGKQGQDWEIARYQGNDRQIRTLGIILKIDKNNRKWIPPGFSPIKISQGNTNDHRTTIADEFLKPAPSTRKSIHWVGETISRVTLASGVNAIIDSHPSISLRLTGMVDGMSHLASPLIDAGFSNTIRTEIVSPTDESAPNSIVLYVFKDS